MGNETSAYNNCKFEREIELSSPGNVILHQATAGDGNPVSVFVYGKTDNSTTESFVDNGAKVLKTLKHPGVITYLGYVVNSDEKWLITERVVPLESVLGDLAPAEICAGLFNVIETLAFLHDRGGICHNNINSSAIFVGKDGSWKIGSFEFACKFSELSSSFLDASRKQRSEKAISPEEKAGQYENKAAFRHSGDAFAFGVFADEILEFLSTLGSKIKSFERKIREDFLHTDPKFRPRIHTLLEDAIFKNDYVEIVNFLKKVTLKTEAEKEKFFSSLAEQLYALPVETVATRLLRPLLSRFVLLDTTACQSVLPSLFTPSTDRSAPFTAGEVNPLLPESLFIKHLIPEIHKIFHVRDAHIRKVLLANFSDYVHLFPKQTLLSLFPQILLALRDNDDVLVSMTLHAVADMVPLLGGDTVIGTYRNKIFSQGLPKFHQNIKDVTSVTQNGTSIRIIPETKPPVKDGEKARKQEEARRRNEERRKKREEQKRKKTAQAAISRPMKHEGHTEESETNHEDHHSADQIPENHTEPNSGEPQNHTEPRVNSFTENHAEPGMYSDEDENHQEPSLDSDGFSEHDDEHELSAIESSLSSLDKDKFAKSRLELQDMTPVKVDWSDVSMETRTPKPVHSDGALKLKGFRRQSSGSRKSSTENSAPNAPVKSAPEKSGRRDSGGKMGVKSSRKSSYEEDFDGWNDTEMWGDVTMRQTPKSDARKLTAENKTHNTGTLGAEFDVMAIDIKPVTTQKEFDFFADMQPELGTKGQSLMSILGNDISTSTSTAGKNSTGTLSFAVDDMGEESGWGEDDWGDIDVDS